MAYEKIVAVFDTTEHAKAAVNALKAGGFHDEDISIIDQSRLAAGKGSTDATLWHRLFGGNLHQHEAKVYGDVVRSGGTVLTLRVLDSEVAHATGILDIHRPVNVHDRAVTTGIAAPAHVDAAAKAIAAVPLLSEQKVAVSPKLAKAHDEVLRLAEEHLEVGKEMVETGRARVRRFVTEKEVTQDVSLHEEHAEVLRRALNEPMALDAIDWSDNEIEVVETAEHALAKKTARLVEEISLKKIGSDHVETIREKLRRQEAEVYKVDASGKKIV
jgi:uncharacterized protein (TIGR02271 family)